MCRATEGRSARGSLLPRAVHPRRVEEARPNPVRSLFFGLVSFSILMFLVAWAGIGELFVPPSPGPGTPLSEMPPPLLALNAALCALPVAAFVLILAGIRGMMRYVPGVGARLIWKVGDHYVSPILIVAIILLGYVSLFVLVVVLAYLMLQGTAVDPILGLATSLVAGDVPIALGWYLMLSAGWALSPVARGRERQALLLAVVWAGVAATVLIAAGVIATLAMGSAALTPNATIPAKVPGVDAGAGVSAFVALVVLTVVARRAARRIATQTPTTVPQPV